ncbi:2-deoxy-5-keto-D-gluconate 6-phosphate aldolase domain-containing protein [Archangium minus]
MSWRTSSRAQSEVRVREPGRWPAPVPIDPPHCFAPGDFRAASPCRGASPSKRRAHLRSFLMSTLQPAPVPHLYLLAFDERHSFENALLGLSGPPTPDEAEAIRHMKTLIYTGFRLALRRGVKHDGTGILVDGQYGNNVARQALEEGILLAMAAEKNGQEELDLGEGACVGPHIETFDPAFTQARVRYNPEDEQEINARRTERLALLTEWLQAHGRRFLLELRVPATQAQLEALGGDEDRYDHELRPSLVVRAMSELQAGGVEPDIWMLESLDRTEDCLRVALQAREGGREHVSCIILDHHADWEGLERCLRVAAPIPGFIGFALGRTLWWEPLQALHQRQLTAAEAAQRICDNYQRALLLWNEALLRSDCQRSAMQQEVAPS